MGLLWREACTFCISIFLVGFEIDTQHMQGRMLLLAAVSWLIVLSLAYMLAKCMMDVGLVPEVTIVAIALSTTALGVLLPILQDTKHASSRFKALVLVVGSISQFIPILVISILFMTSTLVTSSLSLVLFILLSIDSAWFFI